MTTAYPDYTEGSLVYNGDGRLAGLVEPYNLYGLPLWKARSMDSDETKTFTLEVEAVSWILKRN